MSGKVITGYFATIFTIITKLPQIYHSIKTKKTNDISMISLIVNAATNISWVLFGIFDGNYFIIITDISCLLMVILLMGLKCAYDTSKIDISSNKFSLN